LDRGSLIIKETYPNYPLGRMDKMKKKKQKNYPVFSQGCGKKLYDLVFCFVLPSLGVESRPHAC
jgi:hypothetical protein